jgi:hypothetical protein
MSEPGSERPEGDPWRYAIAGFQALRDFLIVLSRDYPATVDRLRRENHGPGGNRVAALRLLRDEYTVVVNNRVYELVRAYLSEGSRLEAREILGRLRHSDLEHFVPPAAWQLLEEDGDDYDYEWIAHLLNDLGLDQRERGRHRRERVLSSAQTSPCSPVNRNSACHGPSTWTISQ